jgi:aerobic-type carbon monoxide dehydrogenase small subunit (CoxS/CutS family)
MSGHDIDQTIYWCPYCGLRTTSAEALKSHVRAEHSREPLPKTEEAVSLVINGQTYHLLIEPETTLSQLLHDRLGLTSVKEFCNQGACGACTVILNGKPTLSCTTLAIECHGAVIETAEHVAAQGHPLIEAYVTHSAMQCGYCTPGFITTAKALLDRNPDPSIEDVKQALAGNLCRCGTYPQHPQAVAEAARRLRED